MIIYSQHADERLNSRNISKIDVSKAINNFDKREDSFKERIIYTKRMKGKDLEVITRSEANNIIVITAYYLEV